MGPDTLIGREARDTDRARPACASLGLWQRLASEARLRLPEARTRRSTRRAGSHKQLVGTPFTAPRAQNRRSWLYRIRPSAMHGRSAASTMASCVPRLARKPSPRRTGCAGKYAAVPRSRPISSAAYTIGTNGDAGARTGRHPPLPATDR